MDFRSRSALDDAAMGPAAWPRRSAGTWTILGIIQAFLMLEPLSVMDLRHLVYLLVYLGSGRDKSSEDDPCRGKCREQQQPLGRDHFRPFAWSLAGHRQHGRCHFRPLFDSET
jgi:hypothetical protein